jgi:hypothetical protein
VSIRNHIYEMARKDAIAMNRISLASSINDTMQHLANKSWTSTQLPFVEALIKLLEKEKDSVLELGLYELTTNHPIKEDDLPSQG